VAAIGERKKKREDGAVSIYSKKGPLWRRERKEGAKFSCALRGEYIPLPAHHAFPCFLILRRSERRRKKGGGGEQHLKVGRGSLAVKIRSSSPLAGTGKQRERGGKRKRIWGKGKKNKLRVRRGLQIALVRAASEEGGEYSHEDSARREGKKENALTGPPSAYFSIEEEGRGNKGR